MNKTRRKAIQALAARVADKASALAALADEFATMRDDLEALRDEECNYVDSMPAGFRESDKGSAAEAACDELTSAFELLELLVDALDFPGDDFAAHLDTARAA
jgi:hypothetical protein